MFDISYRFFGCVKSVAHPSAGGSVPTNISESVFVVTIRSTKWDLFYRLIHNQSLKKIFFKTIFNRFFLFSKKKNYFIFGVNDPKSVAWNIKDAFNRMTPRILQNFQIYHQNSILSTFLSTTKNTQIFFT